jgi:hypothetical protein
VSKNPSAQRRQEVKDAKSDKAFSERQLAKAKDDVSKATFQRSIDRNQRIIDKNTR